MIQKIELDTFSKITNFVSIVSKIDGDIKLIDGTGYRVNAKSLLGAIATMEWHDLYVLSDADIYNKIKEFAVIE